MSNDEMADSPFEDVSGGDSDPAMDANGGLTPSGDGPMARLFDGDAPGPAVDEIRHDYGFPRWAAMVARGTLRVATGSGIPPAFEIVFGSGLILANYSVSTSGYVPYSEWLPLLGNALLLVMEAGAAKHLYDRLQAGNLLPENVSIEH